MGRQSDDQELIREFVSESRDMLDDAEQKLLEMGKASVDGRRDVESINAAFRQFHSIKGSAGFFQFKNISHITHEAETLLDLFRKGKAVCQPAHVDLLCAACDALRKLMNTVENNLSDEPVPPDVSQIPVRLNTAIAAINKAPAAAPPPTPPAPPPPPPAPAAAKPDVLPPAEAQKLASPDMIKLFIQDATELLEDSEHALLELEKKPENNDEKVHAVFRAMHTFKGNSGFLGLTDLQRLSHKTENILELVREKIVPLTPTNVQILLNIVDILKNAVNRLAQEGNADIQGCDVMLQVLAEMEPADRKAAPSPSAPAAPADIAVVFPSPTPAEAVPPPSKTPPVSVEPQQTEAPPLKAAVAPAAAAKGEAAAQVVKQNIRVDVDKLDTLNNLIGELVIAEAMVTNNSDLRGLRLDNFDRSAHHLHRITAALQDIAMSLRMVPLSATLRKMTRLVHDLSTKSGKKLELELVGEDTEVDKTVVELIADPLVHMVRNAADHGIESPEERRAAGKPETGHIRIEARHQSGEVWILISDDGRGLNRNKILAKGIERGLVRGSGENLTDEEIYALIMEPGFSTADTITDISGRGVGMDVVKKNLDKLRGRVVIDTKLGRGTTFILRIPLTLAIIQGMLLQVGRERYVLPMLAIRESFRPTADLIHTVTGRGEMVKIRGELMPVFRLGKLFETPEAREDISQAIIVVVEDGHARVALVVDELLGQQEVVIKSLGDMLGQVAGVSGASILSDGTVGLILDVRSIIRMATGREGF